MIAVVGGGWFGCHIASVLKARGIPFELFEARARLFEGASGYNQNRLHLGFHYPRSAETRLQSRQGFAEFIKRYPSLSGAISANIYAIASGDSLTDYDTYCLVMGNSGLEIIETEPADIGLENVDGALLCNERVIHTNKARSYFSELLRNDIRYEAFDPRCRDDYSTVINCTNQLWRHDKEYDLRFEPCVTLVYSSPQNIAITVMDGPFYSVYPFEEKTATLYSVEYSRIGKYDRHQEAQLHLDRLDSETIDYLRKTMERGVSWFYPAFRDLYHFEGWYASIRSCPTTGYHSRVCHVSQEGNVLHVMPGKIDAIFYAEQKILECLERSSPAPAAGLCKS